MTAFLAFLRLVPLRIWGYIGAAVVLTGAAIAYNGHERQIGRDESLPKIACRTR